jgi:hypothetical protein
MLLNDGRLLASCQHRKKEQEGEGERKKVDVKLTVREIAGGRGWSVCPHKQSCSLVTLFSARCFLTPASSMRA